MEGFPIDLGGENHRLGNLPRNLPSSMPRIPPGGAWLDTVFQPAIQLDLQWVAAIGAAGVDGNGKVFMA
jgi:hypothetical protein